jgi:DNA-binding HxlR family transcriptional regulator
MSFYGMPADISEAVWRQVPQLTMLAAQMASDGHQRDDPMREIFARLGDRWSMLILLVLRSGTYRHAQLRRMVGALGSEGRISQRMLTLRLRDLERNGLVCHRQLPSKAPHVEYALSELGCSLLAEVEQLMGWIRRNSSAIRLARLQFDQDYQDD